jgi:hypothetical protein
MKKELKLVPFAIPSGWEVTTNHFYEIHIDELEEDEWYPFIEDILHIKSKGYRATIDLGWYPEGDINGKFHLELLPWEKSTKAYTSVKKSIKRGFQDENFVYEIKENAEVLWDSPLCSCESQSWEVIRDKLEEIFERYKC